MHDQLPPLPRYYATEKQIDSVLFSGNLQGVEIMMRDSILNAERQGNLETYYHLSLKKVALPFFRLYSEGNSPENVAEAMRVYGDAGAFLKKHLKHSDTLTNPDDIMHARGQISELVLYSLMARDYTDDSLRVPLPTRRINNQAGKEGIDFTLEPLPFYDSGLSSEYIQVKTFVTKDTEYAPHISVVGLAQLDSNQANQWNETSLASTILRELNGEAAPEDTERLDRATMRFYQILDRQSRARQRETA